MLKPWRFLWYLKSKIISTSLITLSNIWTCIDVRLTYHRRPNAVSLNDAKDIIQPIPWSARDTNVISNEWRMFRRTEISFESITFEIRWSNCNSMVSLARDTIEVRIIDKYWWARRGDLERWKVERIKAGWRIFSVEHKEYRERERESCGIGGYRCRHSSQRFNRTDFHLACHGSFFFSRGFETRCRGGRLLRPGYTGDFGTKKSPGI